MSRGRGSRGRRKPFGDNGFEEWGSYMNAKKTKLEHQFSSEASKECENPKGIFHNVSIFVNGYTDPSADELKRIMMVHGGTFHVYLNHKTTHIIAKNLPDIKVKRLKGNEPICTPKWITDSLKAGKLLDFRDYLLYSNQTSSQPKINFAPVKEPEIQPSNSLFENEQTISKDLGKKTPKAFDAKDENFMGEFFSNSRLHHISSMGANFKKYISDLRAKESSFDFPGRQKLSQMSSIQKQAPFNLKSKEKVIMHIDMDSFFVSVGLRSYPQYRGLPVAVTHSKGRNSGKQSNSEVVRKEAEFYEARVGGYNPENHLKSSLLNIADIAAPDSFTSMSEIASCSYEARKLGLKNGMFMGAALKLCPDLKTIPYDFEGYQEVAKTLYDTVARYTLDIQAVSCDEMLVDLTDLLTDCGIGPIKFAEVLRAEIFEATQCTASVGLGPSLLLARLATRKAKPNGVYYLTSDKAQEHMLSVSIQDLPGVGRMLSRKFEILNIETCANLQRFTLDRLMREFGPKSGQSLFEFCRGIDNRTINLVQDRKSVSAEINYGIRFETDEDAKKFLAQLSEEVHQRMVKLNNVCGRMVTLKVMVRAKEASKETAKFLGHGICDSYSRSSNLSSPTNSSKFILNEVTQLLRQLNVNVQDLRGIGIQVSKLDSNQNQDSKGKLTTKSILNFVTKNSSSKTSAGTSAASATSKSSHLGLEVNTGIDPTLSMETSVQSKTAPNHLNNPGQISFSMVDQDVLKELPEDVRKEILEFYSAKNETPTLKEDSSSKHEMATRATNSPEPGPSTARVPISYDELTFSQLDPGVMAALPQEILDEVKQHFSKPSPQKAVRSAFEQMKPAVETSPGVQRRKRGRPMKNSPRFVKRSKNSVPTKSPRKVQRTLFPDDKKKEATILQGIPVLEENSPKKQDIPKVTLDGKRSIEDLRNMFRAWIQSTTNPTRDDVKTVSTFLREVVREKDLDLVYQALKSLCRLSNSTDANSNWTQTYKLILDGVNLEMNNIFGKTLYTNFQL